MFKFPFSAACMTWYIEEKFEKVHEAVVFTGVFILNFKDRRKVKT